MIRLSMFIKIGIDTIILNNNHEHGYFNQVDGSEIIKLIKFNTPNLF